MPHVIYLHSALTQGRIVTRDPQLLRRLFRFELVDVLIAMGIAGMVNAAMLIMAASTFFSTGAAHVSTIQGAYRTLTPLLPPASTPAFSPPLLPSALPPSPLHPIP